ncbi:hypothetical protein ISS07_05890 [Candidatus Woesearchaeota archaeon]|nr:hypothetical protein [Candidatus Woesearchaeota archaeon]
MAKKRVILVALALIFLATLEVVYSIDFNSSTYLNISSSNYISIGKQSYTLGESVNITSNINNSQIIITSNGTSFNYMNPQQIFFTPEKIGDYTLFLKVNGITLGNLSFDVISSKEESIFTNKQRYYFGESVIIHLNNINENFSVSINSKESTYLLLSSENVIEFKPNSIGQYQIQAYHPLTNVNLTADFEVINTNENRENFLIYSDKKEYFLEEFVTLHLNFTKKDSQIFFISSENEIYSFLGELEDKVDFQPRELGTYVAKVEESGRVLASYSFKVLEKKTEKKAFNLVKNNYILGESVEIIVNRNITTLDIFSINKNHTFHNVSRSFVFFPNESGTYAINAYFGNETLSKTFFVTEEIPENYFEINQDVVIDFDLKPIIDSKRSIINFLFGTSPLEKLTFYVENHSLDTNFNLSVQEISKENFRVSIKSNPQIISKGYDLIANITVNGDEIIETKQFYWLGERIKEIPKENKSQIFEEELAIIKQYVNHTFVLEEDAILEVDFTDKIASVRNILEIALKETKLESFTGYVQGHETDERFNLTLDNVELDKYTVRIASNELIARDVYKFVALGTFEGQEVKQEVVFDWGIFNSTLFLERLDALNKEKTIIPIIKNETIINETKINATNGTINILNKTTIKNITIINKTTTQTKKEILLNKSYLNFKNSRDEKLDFEFKILNKEIKQDIGTLTIQQTLKKIQLNKTYNLEVIPKNLPIQKITFFDLNLSEELELGIDSISDANAPQHLPSKKGYAIDPSRLSFSNATLTAVAEGSELYKCKDWNFSTQTCFGSWEKIKEF